LQEETDASLALALSPIDRIWEPVGAWILAVEPRTALQNSGIFCYDP